MPKLKLTIACGNYDRTRALSDGTVQPEGIALNYIPIRPAETFWRMLNNEEFDASEMSLITVRDILKSSEHPDACKDRHGKLRMGAAAARAAGEGVQPHHQRGARHQSRRLRHFGQAACNHRMGVGATPDCAPFRQAPSILSTSYCSAPVPGTTPAHLRYVPPYGPPRSSSGLLVEKATRD